MYVFTKLQVHTCLKKKYEEAAASASSAYVLGVSACVCVRISGIAHIDK